MTGDANAGDGRTSDGLGIDAFAIAGCGSTVIIDDDFDDGATGSEWTVVNTGAYTVAEAGGAVTITFPASAPANTRAAYRQTATINLAGTCAIAEISKITAPASSSFTYVRLGTTTKNVELAIQNSMLVGRFTSGATSGMNGTATYDPVAHRFLRIRQSTPQNYAFEAGPALGGPYTTLGSAGGGIVDPSPTSLEVGGSTTTLQASGAGSLKIEHVLLLGP